MNHEKAQALAEAIAGMFISGVLRSTSIRLTALAVRDIYRKGEEDMRERCAGRCAESARFQAGISHDTRGDVTRHEADSAATVSQWLGMAEQEIRALPLTEDESHDQERQASERSG